MIDDYAPTLWTLAAFLLALLLFPVTILAATVSTPFGVFTAFMLSVGIGLAIRQAES